MTGLLIAFVLTLLIPLFVGTWRTSFLGLSVQGALMAAMALHTPRGESSFAVVVSMFDLVVLRTIALPFALFLVLRAHAAPSRNDVIAPNLFSWGMALTLLVLAFRAADVLVPSEGEAQMLVAVASSAFLLGLFVLATARGPASQIIGVARVENGIALFELGSGASHESLAIRLGQTALLVVSIAFYRWYLVGLARDQAAPAAAATEAGPR